jgi:hypothetical protein
VQRHVFILAILCGLWGGLVILVGVSFLLLATGAIAIPTTAESNAVGLAASLIAGAFTTIGIFTLAWGGAHVWTGVLLHRLDPWGRVVGLALALSDLLVLPFGTALGIYALWVLLTNEGRRLFEPVK